MVKIMENTLVEHIMIPIADYPHITSSDTLRDAITVLGKSFIPMEDSFGSMARGLLVFDEDGRLAGYLRRRDILAALEPTFLTGKLPSYKRKLFDVQVDPNLSEMSFDKMTRSIRHNLDKLVRDVMKPIKWTINVDDHILKAITEMVDNNCSILPVMKDRDVVGVIRTVDLMHEIERIAADKQ